MPGPPCGWCHIVAVALLACRAAAVDAGHYAGHNLTWWEQLEPELFEEVQCKDNATGANVTCKKIHLLALIWVDDHPSGVAYPFFYTYERMRRLINRKQEILPGYELVVDWFDDRWDQWVATTTLTQQLLQHPTRYAAFVQGNDVGATMLSKIAYNNNLLHMGFHIEPALSNRTLAPAYFRTQISADAVSPSVFTMLRAFGWLTFGMFWNDASRSQVMADHHMPGDFTLAFSLPMTDPPNDAPKIVGMVQRHGLRIMFGWTGPTAATLVCELIKASIAGVTMITFPPSPWYKSAGSVALADRSGPEAPCVEDKLAAWGHGSFFIGTSAEHLGKHSCLPSDGDDASGKFVQFHKSEMHPRFKLKSIPVFGAADSMCLWALVARHMLFDRNFSVESLSSRDPAVLTAETDLLSNFELPHGINGRLKWPNPDAWAGAANGDTEIVFPWMRLARSGPGVRLITPTASGLFGKATLAIWPGQGLHDFMAQGAPHPNFFAQCPTGQRRRAAWNTTDDGFPEVRTTCTPCADGEYLVGTECIPCSPGTFSLSGATSCNACLAGQFVASWGQSRCSFCESGRYQAEPQRSLCLDCAPGTFTSLSGATQCEACNIGTFGDGLGQTGCGACPAGLTTGGVGAVNVSKCVCLSGTYHVSSGVACEIGAHVPTAVGFCADCPAGMECAGTATNPLAMVEGPRHMKPRLLPGTMAVGTVAYACVAAGLACPGAAMDAPMAEMCAPGGSGVACAECLANWRFDGHQCVPCTGDRTLALVLFVVGIVVACVFLASITRQAHGYGNFNRAWLRTENTSTLMSAVGASCMLVLQIMALLDMTKALWPLDVGGTLKSTGEVFSLKPMQIECTMENPRSMAVQRTLLMNLMPLIPLSVLAGCYVVGKIWTKEGSKYLPSPEKAVSLIFGVFSTFFLTISSSAINTGFALIRHPSGEASLKFFPFLLTTDSEVLHIRIIGVIGGLVWCVGGLALVTYVLRVLPSRVHDHKFLMMVWPIIRVWVPDKPWWFLVGVIRAFLLCLSTSLFEDGQWQLVYLVIILGFFSLALFAIKPYTDSLPACAEIVGSVGMSVFLVAALPYQNAASGETFVIVLLWLVLATLGLVVMVTAYVCLQMWRHRDDEQTYTFRGVAGLVWTTATKGLPTTGRHSDLMVQRHSARLSGRTSTSSNEGHVVSGVQDGAPSQPSVAEAPRDDGTRSPDDASI